jgi:protein-tyrosine-phosphatase
MAEAVARRLVAGRIKVQSAGVRPNMSDPFTFAVMDELGIDLSSHQPKGFDEIDTADLDAIFSLSPVAHHHALELPRPETCSVSYWPIPDVATGAETLSRQERLEAYRTVRNGIFERIKEVFLIARAPTV